MSALDLDALEREAEDDEFGSYNGLVLGLIERLREAESNNESFRMSQWIDGKTLADQAAEIRKLRNAIEVQVDLRAQIARLERVREAAGRLDWFKLAHGDIGPDDYGRCEDMQKALVLAEK
jgi:hypothetical protein